MNFFLEKKMKQKTSRGSTSQVLDSLGLSNVPAPDTVHLTNKEKLRKKMEAKKAKKEIMSKALHTLSQSKTIVLQHKSFMKQQAQKEKQERNLRQRKTKCQQIAARRTREESEKLRDNAPTHYDMNACIERIDTAPRDVDDGMTGSDEHALVGGHSPIANYLLLYSAVNRDPLIESQRAHLPAIRYEQEVIEAVTRSILNSCVIICGETGSGKTTQIPQFLWEHGFPSLIGITQPRRVAAYAMADRVSKELGETLGEGVGYQVRYHKKVSKEGGSRMKFMTEGILLREVQEDFALTKYSAIVVDEAHERSVTCDVLLGLLSRIVPLRASMGSPLSVIVMSATLRVSDFTENSLLYRVPPKIVHIESRTFTVKVHNSLRNSTLISYLEDAFKKIVQIHSKLPAGAVVCFVPTQRDCEILSQQLQEHFDNTPTRPYDDAAFRAKLNTAFTRKQKHERIMDLTNQGELETSTDPLFDEDQQLDEMYDLNQEEAEEESLEVEDHDAFGTLQALPLYSNLPLERQNMVFQTPPPGKRLCVIATNVAETSLTIPMVRYVVDTGLVKEKTYEPGSNIHKFRTTWVSQSSANQRMGRAGRVAPGHCYRLYNPAAFSTFVEFSSPEIVRTPLESTVLMMRQFGIEHVERFPFPSPPNRAAVLTAVESLQRMGALNASGITELGAQLLAFPVVPRFAVMLVRAQEYLTQDPRVCAFVIDAVSVAATVVDPFQITTSDQTKESSEPSTTLRHPGSDMHTFARALQGYRNAKKNRGEYCAQTGLIAKFMREADLLSKQIFHHMSTVFPQPPSDTEAKTDESDLSKNQELLFRKIISSGLLDCVARIATSAECEEAGVRVASSTGRSTHVAYVRPSLEGTSPHQLTTEVFYIHPRSSVSKTVPAPDWVVFTTLETNVRMAGGANKASRVMMRGVTAVTLPWLHEVGY